MSDKSVEEEQEEEKVEEGENREEEGKDENDEEGEKKEEEKKEEEDPETVWIKEFTGSGMNNLESPIDLNIGRMTVKLSKPLIWCNYEIQPLKMKITNTGKTVALNGEWDTKVPFISGGIFSSKFLFSQLHIHWGPNDMEGSGHSIDGQRFPMELHAVHFNSNYPSHEVAMRKSDGICILVYLFKLQSVENPKLSAIVKKLLSIKKTETSTRIGPWPIDNLLRSFFDDYFLYRGSIFKANSYYGVNWIISREPIGISAEQVAEFRKLKSFHPDFVERKLDQLITFEHQCVYHVNPSGSMYWSLLPISRSLLPQRINNCEEYFEKRSLESEQNS